MLNKDSSFQKFEKAMNALIGVLFLVVVLLISLGSSLPPRVTKINLNKIISPGTEKQILINFNRDMDRESVENNFSIKPNISGKFSWAGHSLAFTPDQSFTYDTDFEVRIKKSAHDYNGSKLKEDYIFDFHTLALQFAYIGVEGDEKNKLMLSNLDGTKRQALTDGIIKIEQFQFCPKSDCVYFLGYKENFYQNHRDELYYIDLKNHDLKEITTDKNFINKSFKLSLDGQTLALTRIQISPTGEYLTKMQVWVTSTQDYKFELFQNGRANGTNFFFSPDGSTLLYLNPDDNFEISSIQKDKSEPQFVGNFSACYGFHPYKPLIVFTKDKTDGFFVLNNELNLYSGDGSIEKLPNNWGLFRDTTFTPDGKSIITIFSGKTETFSDKDSLYPLRIFHLYQYDLEKKTFEQLTSDFDYSEEDPTVSPDSKYLLFQRYETFSKDLVIDPAYRDVTDSLGNILSGGQIWITDLKTKESKKLSIKGTKLIFLN